MEVIIFLGFAGFALAFILALQCIALTTFGYFSFREEPATLNLRVFDPSRLLPPWYAREFFDRVCRELEEYGFKTLAFLRSWDENGELMVLLHNREQMDIAIAHASKSYNHVEYVTNFANGFGVCTINCRQLLYAEESNPRKNIYWHPRVEILNLYRVHREILEKYGSSFPKILPPEEKAVQYLLDSIRKDKEYQMTAGYKKYDAHSDTFSVTIKGALILAWKSSVPIGQIRSLIHKCPI
ncbi:MAG: hypothetical protein GY749_18815 [Desulfobacteraceae bacterium]|nr:hypothetical protein [Desulfobacteraceae bacterium]